MKRRMQSRREPLTRARFDALFEEGGRDLAWDDVQSELAAAREAAYRDGHRAAKDAGDRRRSFWLGVKYAVEDYAGRVGIAVGILLVIWIIWGLCAASVLQGTRELASCHRGETLACQEAVQDCDAGNRLPERKALYLTAYKQATGHSLPPMEKAQ